MDKREIEMKRRAQRYLEGQGCWRTPREHEVDSVYARVGDSLRHLSSAVEDLRTCALEKAA